MAPSSAKSFRCPACKKEAKKEDNSFYPFCSERCQLIDLGRWIDGKYSIEGSDSFSETDEPG